MTNKEAINQLKDMQSRCTNGYDAEAISIAIEALEEQERPTGDRKCVTCKYCDGEIINKPCRTCSHAWADLYEEADNGEQGSN